LSEMFRGYEADINMRPGFRLGAERDRSAVGSGEHPTTIFLTGATGFLGAHVLALLLERGPMDVGTIICLVRGASPSAARQRLEFSLRKYELFTPCLEEKIWDQVEIVCGNVDRERLGLSQEQFESIADRADTVIHTAALVNFVSGYEGELKSTNVDGVHHVVHLAAHGRRSHLVHVSSMSIFGLPLFDGNPDAPFPGIDTVLPTTASRTAYPFTKWMGEQIVWGAKARGLSVDVCRPGCIMGHSESGVSNVSDWFYYYLLSCTLTGVAYDTDATCDFTAVDDVARAVTHLAFNPSTRTGNNEDENHRISRRAYHARSPIVVPMTEIAQILNRETGYSIRPSNFDAWRKVLASLGNASGPLYAMLDSVDWQGDDLSEEKKALQRSNTFRFYNARDMSLCGVDLTRPHFLQPHLLLERMIDWMLKRKKIPEPHGAAVRAIKMMRSNDNTHDHAQTMINPPTILHTAALPSPTVTRSTAPSQESEEKEERGAGGLCLNAGIHAMELYIPQYVVSQSEMEQHDKCPGKYTTGLGQQAIGFCADDEDAVSYALTATMRLLERMKIAPRDIGRIEIGTESQVDRSKSIKSVLVDLLYSLEQKRRDVDTSGFREDDPAAKGFDVEGVDNVHACYGGTAALLNSIAWCESEASDGKYALVVCSDIATQPEEYRFMSGTGCVAMLIGRNAPLVLLKERASHMVNTWDFYKPVGWSNSHAIMLDGKHSVDCYTGCLDKCQERLAAKMGGHGDQLNATDHILFHCTSIYLCKRGFDRWYQNACAAQGQKVSLKERTNAYERMCRPSTTVTSNNGSAYSASCYVNLYSLFSEIGVENMVGRTITVFSYGSGSASTIYRLRTRGTLQLGLSHEALLSRRNQCTPVQFISTTEAYSQKLYDNFDWTPTLKEEMKLPGAPKEDGVFYIDHCNAHGVRVYSRHLK